MLLSFAPHVAAATCRADAGTAPLSLHSCTAQLSPPDAIRALSGLNLPAYDGSWYRIDLDGIPGKRLLDIGLPDAYRLEVYLASEDRSQLLLALDEHSRFSDRPVAHRSLIAPLAAHAGPISLYVHYSTHVKTPLFPRLLTEQQLVFDDTLVNLRNGLLFGVMLVIVPMLAFGLGQQQNRSYRVYAGLVLTNLLFIAQIEGYGFQFAWPDVPAWNMRAPAVLALLVLAWHVPFAISFLQMKWRMPLLYRTHLGVFAAVALTLLLQLAWRLEEWIFLLGTSYSLLACFSAFQGVRQNIPAARFYLLGTLSLVTCTVILFSFSLFWFNPIPQVSVLNYPKMGYLAESMLFAAALVIQIRQFNERQTELRLRRLAETEQLLQAEQNKIAALERAKQQQLKLASASHDISQPLASIRFAIAALGQQQEHKPIAEHIDNTISYAQTLLKDLMEQARQEHQQPELIDLKALFAQLSQEFEGAAGAKGLRLRIRGCGAPVPGSALLLYRIVNNLLANAIRHTNKGRILLGVRHRPGALEIQVWDTGPGIPEATRKAVLKPFRQGHDKGVGYGLGLFIVKTLCEQCGYRLTIHSEFGRGSGFCVHIPTEA